LLAVGLGLIGLFATSCCKCPKLAKDQSEAVGAFLSLGPLEPNRVEVGPTRIRAYNGERVIWTIRNPSPDDVYIELHLISGASGAIPLGTVFASTGGRILVPKSCGIAFLEAQLKKGLVPRGSARGDSCNAETFHYTFMLFKKASSGSTKGESTLCEFPYDPELVVEGKP